MASVAFEQVGKTYPNGYRALVEFDLAIRDGELVVFVGPSGCGKSTLLRLVAGLEQPSSGHVRIGRDIVDDWTPQARNVAMVFQDYALYPTMTVRANLGFPLQMRKLSQAEIRRRVAWATELLALGDLLDRLPKQLSGGQRQRVAMGRALVREPTVFLLDEPLSNLDAQLRTQVRGEIVDLQRRTGTTMIYVTHDQVEAMTMGQRIAVLSRGYLQQSGSPQALYDTPANTFVAGFIGTPPMNLIPSVTLLQAAERAAAAGGPSGMEWLAALTGDPDCHTAGIRPEHVAINRDPQAPGLPGTIVQTEYLGHETLVHFSFSSLAHGDTRAIFIARVDGSPCFENGQPASVCLDGKQLSRFDGNGNRRLG